MGLGRGVVFQPMVPGLPSVASQPSASVAGQFDDTTEKVSQSLSSAQSVFAPSAIPVDSPSTSLASDHATVASVAPVSEFVASSGSIPLQHMQLPVPAVLPIVPVTSSESGSGTAGTTGTTASIAMGSATGGLGVDGARY